MILEIINVLKVNSNENRRDMEIVEGIKHLDFLHKATGLLEKTLETKNYKYFT